MGDGPYQGYGGDPQDPGHSAGGGVQAMPSHPTHTLPGVALTFGSCVRTVCVSECCERWRVSVAVRVSL